MTSEISRKNEPIDHDESVPHAASMCRSSMPLLHAVHTIVQSLNTQHAIDLEVYRRSHTELKNRILHWILIPVETFSFFLLLGVVVSAAATASKHKKQKESTVDSLTAFIPIVKALAWTCGLVSVLIAVDHRMAGAATLAFHVATASLCHKLIQAQGPKRVILIAAVCWTLAFSIQIGVGHQMFEENQPSVANPSVVSWLAMTQSVLIAWSS